jgi:pimeloyl-ACP methyl ester carboxylesterase
MTPLHHMHANGLRFAYHARGEGPLVLLVHGFPDTPHTWDRTLVALADAGFRAVAPFQRGYAPSEAPAGEAYDSDTLGGDVLAWIEALGEREAIVVGHDWGASAAYSAVGLDPTRVRMLVTIGIPHPAGVVPGPRLLWAARHFFSLRRAGAARWIRAGGLAHIDELVQRWSPAWQIPAGETDAAKRCLGEPGSLEAALGYYRALRPWVPTAQRVPVTVPAVVFAGLHDNVPLSAYERARSRYRQGCEIVAMPGGHFMHREHPEHFCRELLRVLAPLRPG